MGRFVGYWCRERRQFVEGYPPQPPKFGRAPMVIGDTMDAVRHPATGEMVDSKSRWERIDKANGCFTSGTNEPARKKRRDFRAEDREWDELIDRAIWECDNGMAPLSEETRAICRRNDEVISKALNMDAHNALGRTRGKGAGRRTRNRRRPNGDDGRQR